jgi:hypothetical protein
MRAVLGADPRPAVRALALRGPDEPAIALLDAWALVADAVSFYTERIAQEGFLRTATERESVRWLARTLGYELRPGVAAAAELAFTVDGTGPAEVLISAGTPVLTVPGQDQQPQTFETDADLVARATWNSIAGPDGERQELTPAGPLWLRGTGLGLRRGDPLLLVGAERLEAATAKPAQPPPILSELDFWDLRLVDAVLESPPGLPGWTRLEQHSVRTSAGVEHPLPGRGAAVFTFAERADIFGWNALPPVPAPPVPAPPDPAGQVVHSVGGPPAIDLDGDHPRLTGGDAPDAAHASWLVLLSAGDPKLCRVVRVTPAGPSDTSLPGRITRVQVDVGPGVVTARGTIALCGSVLLPADQVPRTGSVAGPALELIRTEPGLPPGRHVLVTGLSAASGVPVAEPAVVVTCAPSGATMTVVLDRALADPIDPQTLRVLGNAVGCTHGETVRQVLGSGDGTANFQRFHPARGPLTYVGADGPTGAASTLRLTVDDVTWTPVPALAQAGPQDRVYALEQTDGVDVVLGDGTHGARAPTGAENVSATYRVGIGATGAAAGGQLTQLPRRALGVRSVVNPGAAHDWADPETLEEARSTAPLRIRTLDRAVSVADHGDFAGGFAGVGQARADQVWDGRTNLVVVSLLGTAGQAVGDPLIAHLGAALAAARDPAVPLLLMRGDQSWFGVRVELRLDPAFERPAVEAAVRDLLAARAGAGVLPFTAGVTAARVLVWVRSVPGVLACTMPRLLPLAAPPPDPAERPASLPADDDAVAVLAALPARSEGRAIRPAQLLALPPGGVDLGVMGP